MAKDLRFSALESRVTHTYVHVNIVTTMMGYLYQFCTRVIINMGKFNLRAHFLAE